MAPQRLLSEWQALREICPASSPLALDPVQHMDPERRGEIAVGQASIVNFGDQLRKRDFPGVCDRLQFKPEGLFQREAGPVAMQCGGMLADQRSCLRNESSCLGFDSGGLFNALIRFGNGDFNQPRKAYV
jgi:hypothetical protein